MDPHKTAPPNPEERPSDLGRNVLVTVHDEDAGGDPIKIEAHPSATVDSVLAAIYPYFPRLGAAYYDGWPPSVVVVEPGPDSTWVEASANSMWWPKIEGAPFSFGAHNPYTYPGGQQGQLLCFSHTLEYYLSSHGP